MSLSDGGKVVLRRAKLRAGEQGAKGERLDVTAKSASPWAAKFAPPWDLVSKHKAGAISDAVYETEYFRQLDSLGERAFYELLAAGMMTGRRLTFLCYCSRGFCHTHLLIGYAVAHYPEWFEDGRRKTPALDASAFDFGQAYESEKTMHMLAVDLETTGLDSAYHEITQIGAILLDSKLEELGEFETLVRIEHPERGLEGGFDVFAYTGIDPEELKRAPTLRDALRQMEVFVRSHVGFGMKSVVVFGQNPAFDASFIKAGYKKQGWKYPFDFHVLGLESMYVYHQLRKTGKIPADITLRGICKTAGVKNAKAHNAIADIRATVDAMRKLLEEK